MLCTSGKIPKTMGTMSTAIISTASHWKAGRSFKGKCELNSANKGSAFNIGVMGHFIRPNFL